ncbi:DUF2783 domain-containing protein [Aestuariivita sp.]|jgi:hypothetical protein|uniref:DUF2783 domain-containing protein n=1 Tax=Aestuariivita sp. TaxID=1872407 RepID=UPI0021707790|nr:DUF2783 domain-containing protein [Aestuariivita sp.]MCE8007594.1 DUF2783 domain-containing protein [Aestuariivita sp.]
MTIYPDRLSPNQDDVYNALMAAHEGLSEDASHALNARLVLLMANQIGDPAILIELMQTAQSYADG